MLTSRNDSTKGDVLCSDSDSIQFFVPGLPKAQPRPRAFARQIAAGKWQARVYDPGTAEAWKSSIAIEARSRRPAVPWAGPIALEVTFYMPRPRAHFKLSGALRDVAPTWHTAKPDTDNLIKAVKDCLTVLGFWHDDKQVCDIRCQKQYGSYVGAAISIKRP